MSRNRQSLDSGARFQKWSADLPSTSLVRRALQAAAVIVSGRMQPDGEMGASRYCEVSSGPCSTLSSAPLGDSHRYSRPVATSLLSRRLGRASRAKTVRLPSCGAVNRAPKGRDARQTKCAKWRPLLLASHLRGRHEKGVKSGALRPDQVPLTTPRTASSRLRRNRQKGTPAGMTEVERRGVLRGAIALGLAAAVPYGQAWPQNVPKSVGPPRGSLLVMGGGDRGVEIQRAGWTLGGGANARWVYIPTGLADDALPHAKPPVFARRAHSPVEVLHTRDRAMADSDAFVRPLAAATAVFIEGGRQWRLADAYVGTRVEGALRGVLDRGGLIAGTSAGASILASYLVRGSPLGNAIVMSPGHERGFGFVSGAAVDPHVVKRHREADLATVVASHPGLLGIGLDEGAAVIVRGNTLTPLNHRAVLITDGADHGDFPYYRLPPAGAFDLATWRRVKGS